ncbi:MAG: hypothetical protein WC080_02695 [Patescibacteria group bacterium]|jgi:endonuclease/exonuclease/phosphatase (EEP) superfamily protein YafD
MKNSTAKFFLWIPRILSILFIIFISIFALDVFSESQWLFALLMHLIPTAILIILTAIAWKNEWIGGMIFFASGVIFLIATRLEAYIIALPLIAIGVLFLLSKKYGLKK